MLRVCCITPCRAVPVLKVSPPNPTSHQTVAGCLYVNLADVAIVIFFVPFLPLTSQEWLLGGVVSRRFASRRFVFCKGCERPSLFSWRYHGQCLVVVRSTNACLLLCGIVRVLVAGLDRGIVDISLGTFMAGVMHGPSLRTPLVCYCHFSRSWRRAGFN